MFGTSIIVSNNKLFKIQNIFMSQIFFGPICIKKKIKNEVIEYIFTLWEGKYYFELIKNGFNKRINLNYR